MAPFIELSLLTILGPLVLPTDLVLLLGSEIVLNVEGLADLLGRLALDHVGNGLATDIEKWLDIKVVGGKNNLEEHLLVDLHKLLVPFFNVGGLLARITVLIGNRDGVAFMVITPFDDFAEDRLVDVGDGDGLISDVATNVLDHVLDEDGTLRNFLLDWDLDVVRGHKLNLGHFEWFFLFECDGKM